MGDITFWCILHNARLWAASGQSALESARVLVISASATSTSILKNLVLPGIGHFTILDPENVNAEDAGNNFFLDGPDSIGKSRAEEAVRLLQELNESVEGFADTSVCRFQFLLDSYACSSDSFRSCTNEIFPSQDLQTRLADTSYLASYSIVIAHNLSYNLVNSLSKRLWSDPSLPPLIVVRSAGFLADFYIQIHEHTSMSILHAFMSSRCFR